MKREIGLVQQSLILGFYHTFMLNGNSLNKFCERMPLRENTRSADSIKYKRDKCYHLSLIVIRIALALLLKRAFNCASF